MITRKAGCATVVPDSDKRPEIVVGEPGSEFEDETASELI